MQKALTYTIVGRKKTEIAYRWFAEGIDVYNSGTLESMMTPILANDPDGSLQKYVTSIEGTSEKYTGL